MGKRPSERLKETSAPTLEERRVVSPPSGVPINPPDISAKNSIFNSAAPTLSEVDHMEQTALSTIMEGVDIPHLERRITLIARLVLEDTLWSKEGLTKKERAEIALNAIRTLEGSKSTLWVEDPTSKNIPKTTEAMQKEKARIEERLERLLHKRSTLKKVVAEAALEVIEAEGEGSNG